MATQVRRAAAAPIYRCLLQEELFERGNGMLLLARGTSRDGIALVCFLLDVYCLGVKDVAFHAQLGESDIETMLADIDQTAPLEPIEPSHARKLIYETVAYARSVGIEPHRDYVTAERLFGDIPADAGGLSFSFGYEGRPLYVPGIDETAAQVRRRLQALRNAVGEDGFDVSLPEGDEEDLPYDADVIPDPAVWLAASEDERLEWVGLYHDGDDYFEVSGIDPEEARQVHIGLHVAVENQLAANDPLAARRAMQRLSEQGVDRHDAIHAIAWVLLTEMVASEKEQRDFSNQGYEAGLDALTLESWHRQTGSKGEFGS